MPVTQLAMSPRLISTLRNELRAGYDVVHAHVSVVSPVGYAAAAVAQSLGLPTVVTFHSVLRFKSYVLSAANAMLGLTARPIVWSAVSSLVASQVRRALGEADVAVLVNGLDTRFWQASHGSRAADAPVTLVSTMRLQRKKRPSQLVRAFSRAAAGTATPMRLVVVGDGPDRAALEQEALELQNGQGAGRIEFTGWLDATALRSVYRQADGFVLASVRESFGIAALEARAAGLPVIAMAAAGSSEFLVDEQNALLCVDDAHLTRSIARFATDVSLRSRLADCALPLHRYDWSASLAAHEAAYGRAARLMADWTAIGETSV